MHDIVYFFEFSHVHITEQQTDSLLAVCSVETSVREEFYAHIINDCDSSMHQCLLFIVLSLSLSLSFSLCAQPRAPLYAYAQMTEEQRIQLVQRLTLIQCLPCGRYADTSSSKEEKKSLEVDLEESTTTGSGGHCEKKGDKGDKGDKDREWVN